MAGFADDPRAATRQAPLAVATFAKGEVLAGKYRIETVLGRGGMGHVFAAMHLELDQVVAIKVMHKDLLADADAVMRFGREAKAAAAMRGNHTARIFDVGKLDSGQPYMVMEHLEGRDLASLVDTGARIELADAFEWIAQACEAVAEAHDLGVVHRDIKPHNLFLTRDRNGRAVIKVLDFGLAKAFAPEKVGSMKETTRQGEFLGSPFYVSPEQASGKKVDHRTDVWSLGATLYHLVAGVPPFYAATSNLVCAMLLTEDFPPIITRRPDAPPALEALLRRCMTRDVNQRLGSVRAMLDELRALVAATRGSPSNPDIDSKRTVRMGSAPSWPNVPVTPLAPSSSPQAPARATVPLNAFPQSAPGSARKPARSPSRAIWIGVSIGFFVATAFIIALVVYLTR
jgi:serine/threonine-protein kinase